MKITVILQSYITLYTILYYILYDNYTMSVTIQNMDSKLDMTVIFIL